MNHVSSQLPLLFIQTVAHANGLHVDPAQVDAQSEMVPAPLDGGVQKQAETPPKPRAPKQLASPPPMPRPPNHPVNVDDEDGEDEEEEGENVLVIDICDSTTDVEVANNLFNIN
jgi:hypothetical protein